MSRRRLMLIATVPVAAAAMAACAVSPEAARTRGGGPGADIGNHGQPVDMHGATNPAFQVPLVGRGIRQEQKDSSQ